jgi:hypothetical protein
MNREAAQSQRPVLLQIPQPASEPMHDTHTRADHAARWRRRRVEAITRRRHRVDYIASAIVGERLAVRTDPVRLDNE